jgi:hypothetical protein
LTNLEAVRILDRLLTADNETINDLLDQALTVARMVNPDSNHNIPWGPMETILRQNQRLIDRVNRLESATTYLTPDTDMSATTYDITDITSGAYSSSDNLTYIMDNIVLSDLSNDIDINLNSTDSNK